MKAWQAAGDDGKCVEITNGMITKCRSAIQRVTDTPGSQPSLAFRRLTYRTGLLLKQMYWQMSSGPFRSDAAAKLLGACRSGNRSRSNPLLQLREVANDENYAQNCSRRKN